MNNKKVIIGIDLGPTSVGIAAIDEDGKVLEKPSILRIPDNYDKTGKFTSCADRRKYRGIRRRYSRKKTIKRDFKKMVLSYFPKIDFKKIFTSPSVSNIYDLKSKVLLKNENITTEDFIKCLYHYLGNRGCIVGGCKLENNKLPIEHLFDLYQKNGSFKFNKIDSNSSSKDNRITRDDYIREIDLFFSKWDKQNILQKFKERFFEIYKRHRSYEYGPGNSKTKTKWGLCYQNSKKPKDKQEKLFDHLIGKCSVYPNEKRSIRNVSFEIFKFLEFINNHTYINLDTGEVNGVSDKKAIFKYLLENTCNLTESKIKKQLKIQINRFKSDEEVKYDKKNFFHLFFYKKNWKKSEFQLFDEDGLLDISFLNKLNEIDYQIKDSINLTAYDESSKNKEYNRNFFEKDWNIKWKEICNKIGCSKENIYDEILNNYDFAKSYFRPCKLSIKALNNSINLLLESNKKGCNLQSLISEYSNIFGERQNISINNLISQIGTPNVKRITLLAMLALEKYLDYYNFSKDDVIVCIETTHNHNSIDEKNRIYKANENNRKLNEAIFNSNKNINKRDIQKLRLYEECGGISVYTGNPIDKNNLREYEIDHIYNREWSGDNSFNNKVLVESEQNRYKSVKTVAEFLGRKKQEIFAKTNKGWLTIKEKNLEKYNRLINPEIDYHKINESTGFVGRNLSDTSYISTTVEKIFRKKFGLKQIYRTNGKITSVIRNIVFAKNEKKEFELDFIKKQYDKKRQEYKHHGIDAICIAYSYFYSSHVKSNIEKNRIGENEINLSGEIKKKANLNSLIDLIKDDNNFLFWTPTYHRLKKDFYNETLSSFVKINGKYYQLNKAKIMDESNDWLNKNIFAKEKNVLMSKSEPKLFNIIRKIFLDHIDISKKYKINAFQYYMNEMNDTLNPKDLECIKYTYLAIINYKNTSSHNPLMIKEIKYLNNSCTNRNLFYSPRSQRGNNKLGGYTTFPFKRLLLFKEDNQWKYLHLNVNLVELNTKDNNYLKSFNNQRKEIIDKGYQYFDIFKGQKIALKKNIEKFSISNVPIKNDDLFEICSFKLSDSRFEIKNIKNLNRVIDDNGHESFFDKQLTISIKSLIDYFDFIKIDILGNIKKRIIL